jgi:hypothetical protein
MQFRHDRRRRVLADEFAQAENARPVKEARLTPPERAEIYSTDARRDRQPRLIDFVPRRNLTFSLLALGAILLVSGLEALLVYKDQIAHWLGAEAIRSLDPTQPTSIASWLSALLLATCAMLALMIYSVRRWRVDDYHRRYRVWLIAALVTAVFSIDQTASVLALCHRPFQACAEASNLTPATLYGLVSLSLLVLASLRLWFELRRSRGSVCCWIVAASCFAVSAASTSQWLHFDEPIHLSVVQSAAHLVGVWSLLFTFALYQRFVLLEVEGRLPVRPGRQRKRRKKDDTDAPKLDAEIGRKPKPQSGVRTDLEPVAKETSSGAATKEAAVSTAAGAKPKLQWDSSASQPNQQLSRAERKKLKRDMRRQAA